MLKIIDVSNWQRGEIDLSKLDKLGYDGVMMKATEGKSFKDKSLDYFMTSCTEEEMVNQMRKSIWFLSLCQTG